MADVGELAKDGPLVVHPFLTVGTERFLADDTAALGQMEPGDASVLAIAQELDLSGDGAHRSCLHRTDTAGRLPRFSRTAQWSAASPSHQ